MSTQPSDASRQWSEMQAAVQSFHDRYRLRDKGGEDLVYRVALMAEELGEISAAVTKGKPRSELAEECADLLILLVGTAIAAELDLESAFWAKLDELMARPFRMVDGRIRVSRFDGVAPSEDG